MSYVFILLTVSSGWGWGHRGNKSPSLSPLKKVRMQSNSSFFRDRSLKVHGFPGIAESPGEGEEAGLTSGTFAMIEISNALFPKPVNRHGRVRASSASSYIVLFRQGAASSSFASTGPLIS